MKVKLIEIRDSATFIPAMAVRLFARSDAEMFLLRRAGYSREQIEGRAILAESGIEPYVILCKLDGVEAQYDAFSWTRSRTMGVAHRWIIEHWAEVSSGAVVDVQFILGETDEPKRSEST